MSKIKRDIFHHIFCDGARGKYQTPDQTQTSSLHLIRSPEYFNTLSTNSATSASTDYCLSMSCVMVSEPSLIFLLRAGLFNGKRQVALTVENLNTSTLNSLFLNLANLDQWAAEHKLCLDENKPDFGLWWNTFGRRLEHAFESQSQAVGSLRLSK